MSVDNQFKKDVKQLAEEYIALLSFCPDRDKNGEYIEYGHEKDFICAFCSLYFPELEKLI